MIDRFINWLYEDVDHDKSSSAKRQPGRALLAAPKAPKQITQHSFPTPQRLAEIAAQYEAGLFQIRNEEYEAFFTSGYPNFVQWVESQIEKSAAFGGRFLLLTFDNSTGIVTAATTGPRQILGPNSYATPISHCSVRRLATEIAEHFYKADFGVRTERIESAFSCTGVQQSASCDTVVIVWSENEQNFI